MPCNSDKYFAYDIPISILNKFRLDNDVNPYIYRDVYIESFAKIANS